MDYARVKHHLQLAMGNLMFINADENEILERHIAEAVEAIRKATREVEHEEKLHSS